MGHQRLDDLMKDEVRAVQIAALMNEQPFVLRGAGGLE
jgi:hypothetical protein